MQIFEKNVAELLQENTHWYGASVSGGLLGGIICTYFSVAHVPQGHRGIVFSKFGGVLVGDNFKLKEGFNFIIPWLHRAIIFDIRTREKIIDLHFGSKGNPFYFPSNLQYFYL